MTEEREASTAVAPTSTQEERDIANAQVSDNASDDHVRDEKEKPAPVLTKRQKVKRHCGRFKWWYLLGVVIFLAILLPIL